MNFNSINGRITDNLVDQLHRRNSQNSVLPHEDYGGGIGSGAMVKGSDGGVYNSVDLWQQMQYGSPMTVLTNQHQQELQDSQQQLRDDMVLHHHAVSLVPATASATSLQNPQSGHAVDISRGQSSLVFIEHW